MGLEDNVNSCKTDMKKIFARVKGWLDALARLFFPRHCVVCGDCLQQGEEALCMRCNIDMPRTGFHLQRDNEVERMFWGKIPLERATAYFYYSKGSSYRHILHQLKYNGRHDVGEAMGRFMAAELQAAGFFEGIDVVVPVPLHRSKQRARGYNQSECIARGIARVTGIGVDRASVVRLKNTATQTRKSAYERWENVREIFAVRHPERFAGKHLLLVDDVLTTGATLTACADAFTSVEGIRISILALAVAR